MKYAIQDQLNEEDKNEIEKNKKKLKTIKKREDLVYADIYVYIFQQYETIRFFAKIFLLVNCIT